MTTDDVLFTLAEGRYEVCDPIGAGGMATVHRCRDRRLGIERAIKIVNIPARPSSSIQRCLDEARAMASVDHPAILPAVDAGIQGSRFYLVMPLAAESLASRVRRLGPLSPRAAAELMIPVLQALQAAHDRRIIHRDVKPENILVDARDRPMLADFGVALLQDRDEQLTRTGAGLGTWATMAPEQRLDAHRVGPPADVYAAGATLYHLITAQTPLDLFMALPASPRWEGIPDALRALLQRATALDAGQRPTSASDFATELARLLPDLPDRPAAMNERSSALDPPTTDDASVARPDPPSAAPPRPAHALGAAVVAVATIPLVLGLLFLLSPGTGTPIAAPAATSAADAVGAGAAHPERHEEGPPPDAPPAAEAPSTPASAVGPAPAIRREAPPRRPEPPADAPDLPVPALPIHGAWTGSLDGRSVRVDLAGHADALRALVRGGGEAAATAGHGSFVAPRHVEIVVDPRGPAPESWRLELRAGRLEGIVERPFYGDLVPVTLRRATDP